MKRFHAHVAVGDVSESISFYTNLFGLPPMKVQADYAKWELEDPRVNFAISARGHAVGLNHFGFQAETPDELAELTPATQNSASTLLRISDVGER